jgi:hypothetical protein
MTDDREPMVDDPWSMTENPNAEPFPVNGKLYAAAGAAWPAGASCPCSS